MTENLNIAIVGCLHGKLKQVYDDIEKFQSTKSFNIDLVLVCGDFQSIRNESDLNSMAVPMKYRHYGDFKQYYENKLTAPVLTIFVGGNHEASNYLWRLPFGGFICKNIYYMGYSNVVDFAGFKIGGVSGIYKPYHYDSGHLEKLPLSEQAIRSIYHLRKLDVDKINLYSHVDIMISHDWPTGVWHYGDINQLMKDKPFFRKDIVDNTLGGYPFMDILNNIYPDYFFSAHLHCYFNASVPHTNNNTEFIALDKTLPRRKYIEYLTLGPIKGPKVLRYDEKWLAVTKLFSSHFKEDYYKTPDIVLSEDCLKDIKNRFDDLTISDIWDVEVEDYQKDADQYPTKQTATFCEKLDIANPCL